MSPTEFPASFCAAVALQALRADASLPDLAHRYGVSEAQVQAWRDRLTHEAGRLFEPHGAAPTAHHPGLHPTELALTIAENSTQGLAMMDERGYCIYANRAWLDMTGFSAEEIRSRPLHDLVHHHHPDGRPYPLQDCPIDRALPENFEVRAHRDVFFRKDGSTFPVLCAASPVFRGGRPVATVIEIRDVTAQQQAERELLESRQRALEAAERAERERARLDAVLQAAPVGIGMADAQGRLLKMNPANYALWGQMPAAHSVAEYDLWKAWWADGSARHGQRLQPHDWAMARALRGEVTSVPDIIEIEPFDQPGVRRTVANHGAPVRDADGRIIGAVVAQTDITALVHTEQALRDSEARFRTITEAMPQMVWSARADGHHDYFNPQWYAFTGATPGAGEGQGWSDMFHPEDRPRAWEQWQHSVASGQSYEIEYRLRHHSGQYRWVLGRALPVRDEQGVITRWMGTCTDIHDQKCAEAALVQANRGKDEFLAMLGHELRNPLAPLSAAAQLLQLASTDEARVRQIADIVARQVRHMTALVDDLLDVSRLTRGLVQLQLRRLDLRCVVLEAVEQAQPLMTARRHELRLQLPDAAVAVDGDRTRLVQTISNLLSNAAKYTPPGGRVDVQMQQDHGRAMLCVADNGCGIAPTLLPHVFDLFVQGERQADRSQGGLGLGLALVRKIAQLHEGQVEACSDGEGRGSTFVLRLPLADGEPQVARPADAPTSVPASQRPQRVMVVDDNQDAAKSLAALLESEGHAVTLAFTPQDALHLAASASAQQPYEVCILDIGLPGMDGYELARRLRHASATAGSCLIALTGYGQDQDVARSQQAGFHHHFVKPVQWDQLRQVLSNAVPSTASAHAVADRTDQVQLPAQRDGQNGA